MAAEGMAGAHEEHGVHVRQGEEAFQLGYAHARALGEPSRVVAAEGQLLAQETPCMERVESVVLHCLVLLPLACASALSLGSGHSTATFRLQKSA